MKERLKDVAHTALDLVAGAAAAVVTGGVSVLVAVKKIRDRLEEKDGPEGP